MENCESQDKSRKKQAFEALKESSDFIFAPCEKQMDSIDSCLYSRLSLCSYHLRIFQSFEYKLSLLYKQLSVKSVSYSSFHSMPIKKRSSSISLSCPKQCLGGTRSKKI